MKKTLFLLAGMCLAAIFSCTKDKTNYGAETDPEGTEGGGFREALSVQIDGRAVSIETRGGTFRKGWNDVRARVANGTDVSAVTFLPVRTDVDGEKTSCPHRRELAYDRDGGYFSGHAVFTEESGPGANWTVRIAVSGQTHTAEQNISVGKQPNKNLGMAVFTGTDGERYVIALASPAKPKVGENEMVAGVYKRVEQSSLPPEGKLPDGLLFSYAEAGGFTLKLDPRMPEPSMGNHSSPNNKDLTQGADGLYHGRVNYTMTGNWTLNFLLLDENGEAVKGTEVPTDFTPGLEGAKSELHIDVLL